MAKEMIIEKSIVINKPQQEVFQFLKLSRNQDTFSVWNMKDPTKKITTEGTDGTEGFIYSWDSKDKSVGAGSQQIAKNYRRVKNRIRTQFCKANEKYRYL